MDVSLYRNVPGRSSQKGHFFARTYLGCAYLFFYLGIRGTVFLQLGQACLGKLGIGLLDFACAGNHHLYG
jgi:hypothetical protein